MNRSHLPLSIFVAALLALSGCGGGPPKDLMQIEIEKAVFTADPGVFVADPGSAEVLDVAIGSWQTQSAGDSGKLYEAEWTARLRLRQPIGFVVAEVEGKNVVQVVAETGFEVPYRGRCGGGQQGESWGLFAHVVHGAPQRQETGSWTPLYDKVPELRSLTMGYPVVRNGVRSTPKMRSRILQSLSQLQPAVIVGTEEEQQLQASSAELAARAQAAAEERARVQREAREAQQKQAAAEAAERQRLAEEERQRKQAEAAETARIAREAAEQKAQAERHARLLKVLEPLRSEHGATITAEVPPAMGVVLLDARIEDATLRVTGRGVDLREMPFREFTYEGSVDERSTFSYRTSLGGEPVAFTLRGEQLLSRSGLRLTPLAEADRKSLDESILEGRKLGTAEPVSVSVEVVPSEDAVARAAQLQLVGLQGTVIFQDRLNARLLPLFAADLASRRNYAFKPGEVVSIRLASSVTCSGVFLRGATTPSTEFVVTINGVHRVTVPSIANGADVILALPAGMEVLDLRLAATGSVALRTMALVR